MSIAAIAPIPLELAASRLEGSVKEKEAVNALGAFVEGGLRGWLNVAGAFIVLMVTFGYANSFGVYQSYYQLNQFRDKTPSDISWIGSSGMGIEFCCAFISGPLFDRGYFRSLMITGSLGFTFFVFMTSLSKEYYQTFLAQAVGLGLSMGCTYMPAISVINHSFRARKSFCMGIAMAGSSVGGIVFPIMLNKLFPRIGFGNSVRASGYTIAGLFLVANLIMKARYPPVKRDADGKKAPRPSPKKLMKEPRYFWTSLGTTLICLGVFFPLAYIQVFAESAGLPRNVSDNILAILNAASFFGRILPNFAADTVGTFNSLTVSGAGVSILIFALYGATTAPGVIVFALLYGFCSGAFVSLLSPLLISTADDVSEIGMRQGLALVINGLAALCASPIAGALLDAARGNFKYAIAFGGGVVAAGTAAMVVATREQAKVKGQWRV